MQRTKGLLLCFICLLYSRAYVKHLPVKSEGTVSFMLFSVQLLHRDLRRTLVALFSRSAFRPNSLQWEHNCWEILGGFLEMTLLINCLFLLQFRVIICTWFYKVCSNVVWLGFAFLSTKKHLCQKSFLIALKQWHDCYSV